LDAAARSPDVLAPVSTTERLELIDVVRGFALFGVLLANLVWITTDVMLTDARLAVLPTAPLDRVAKQLVVFFIDHKFYTIFSFLFGLGFAVQLSRFEQRGAGAGVYARRLAILAVIGLLHIALLWFGDILLIYAIAGFGLLIARHWDSRTLIVAAIVLGLSARAASGLVPLLTRGTTSVAAATSSAAAAEKERKLAIFDGSSYPAIVRENVAFYYSQIVAAGVWLFLVPQVFARFLLGLYVGRRRWAARTADIVSPLRRVLPWTMVIGVIGNAVMLSVGNLEHSGRLDPDSVWLHLAAPVEEVGVLAMAFSYVGVIVLLFHASARWRQRLERLALVGRMALSNYLTHSVLYLLLLTGIGLGLYGDIGPAVCIALSIVIFSAQVVFSRWWLARFRFGPAEWAWRSLTYGRVQPMRRAAVAEAT
jgi:uncharacterized protein